MNKYLLDSRLRALEKKQKEKRPKVCIVIEKGKHFFSILTGKKINPDDYSTIIINDIPRKAEQEKEGG